MKAAFEQQYRKKPRPASLVETVDSVFEGAGALAPRLKQSPADAARIKPFERAAQESPLRPEHQRRQQDNQGHAAEDADARPAQCLRQRKTQKQRRRSAEDEERD